MFSMFLTISRCNWAFQKSPGEQSPRFLSTRSTPSTVSLRHCVSVVNFLIASLRVSLAQGARSSCPDDAHLGRDVCFSQGCTAFRLATHAECRAHGSCSGLAGDDLPQTIAENYPSCVVHGACSGGLSLCGLRASDYRAEPDDAFEVGVSYRHLDGPGSAAVDYRVEGPHSAVACGRHCYGLCRTLPDDRSCRARGHCRFCQREYRRPAHYRLRPGFCVSHHPGRTRDPALSFRANCGAANCGSGGPDDGKGPPAGASPYTT